MLLLVSFEGYFGAIAPKDGSTARLIEEIGTHHWTMEANEIPFKLGE
jgi:hypothetical protein